MIFLGIHTNDCVLSSNPEHVALVWCHIDKHMALAEDDQFHKLAPSPSSIQIVLRFQGLAKVLVSLSPLQVSSIS